MSKIKPSQREKKRYIVFEIKSKEDFSQNLVKNAIFGAIYKYIGEFGFAKTRIYFVKNLYAHNKGVIRVTNKSVSEIKLVLTQVKDINNNKAKIDIIGISGILKKAKYKFLLNEIKK